MSEQVQAQLEQAGIFRAKPLSWTAEPSPKEDSQSVAIAIQFGILQQWHPDEDGGGGGQWSQPWPQGYYTYNRTYVIGKDGKPSAGAIDALSKCGLWKGDWDALASPPPDVVVIIDVQLNDYQGKTSHRAEWVNPNAEVPEVRGAGFKPVNPDLLSSLRARFGGQTKALAGGNPQGAPPSPPPAAGAPTPAPAAAAGPTPATGAPAPATAPAPAAGAPPAPATAPPPPPAAAPPPAAGPPAGAPASSEVPQPSGPENEGPLDPTAAPF